MKRKTQLKNGKSKTSLRIIWWIVAVGIPLWLTYFFVWDSKLELIPLDPLDKADALTAPFELKNGGVLDIHRVQLFWIPKNVLYNQGSHVTGDGHFTSNGQCVQTLRPNEKATFKSPLPTFFPAPIVRADLEIIISYRSWFIPIVRNQCFRFGTAPNKDGIVRWFSRPLNN